MKKTIYILLTILSMNGLAQNSEKDWYISRNLLSPLAGMNLKSTAANVLLPLVSNLEYGFTLAGGFYQNSHQFETRFAIGRSNPYNLIPQVQVGYNFYLLDFLKKNKSGFYVGSFARWWDYKNRATDNHLQNISLNFTLGYTWKKKRLTTDLRLNQPLLLYSHSSVEHYSGSAFEVNTSPMPALSPVLPFLSINIGYKLRKPLTVE